PTVPPRSSNKDYHVVKKRRWRRCLHRKLLVKLRLKQYKYTVDMAIQKTTQSNVYLETLKERKNMKVRMRFNDLSSGNNYCARMLKALMENRQTKWSVFHSHQNTSLLE